MAQHYSIHGDDFDFQLYNFDADQKICKKHIKDAFFIAYISDKGVAGKCSYCKKECKVLELSEILRLIVVGIDYLYEDPANSRYLNKEGEHGFDGSTFGFYEMWENLGLEIRNVELAEDIYNYLQND